MKHVLVSAAMVFVLFGSQFGVSHNKHCHEVVTYTRVGYAAIIAHISFVCPHGKQVL